MLYLLLIGHTLAGVVTDVPAGEPRVALVVCPTEEPCSSEIFKVEAHEHLPMILLELMLEQDTAGWAEGESLDARFSTAMDRAKGAVAAKHWEEADIALDDAEATLQRWSGTVDNQQLFELYYVRGAVRLARGDDPTADLRQAAAVAWNREVALPLPDPVATAYYAAMTGLLTDGTGTIRLAAPPPGAAWFLDGVPIGDAAAEVRVFPATHRVTARGEGNTHTSRRDVQVRAGQRREVALGFSRADDTRWVQAQIRAAFAGGTLPPEVMGVLSDWCVRKDVHQLRLLLVADPVQVLDYDPQVRRLVRP
jgi:hypothetical protein